MKLEGEGKLLRIFIGESDRWKGKSLAGEIVKFVRKAGLAGATVLRGLEGFGAKSRIHTASILRLSQDLPLVVEIVDRADRIDAVLPELQEMVGDGLITLEKVQILKYHHS